MLLSNRHFPVFNILSLDSASYEGYMTASTIDYMEHAAYFSAVGLFGECFPKRKNAKISMAEQPSYTYIIKAWLENVQNWAGIRGTHKSYL